MIAMLARCAMRSRTCETSSASASSADIVCRSSNRAIASSARPRPRSARSVTRSRSAGQRTTNSQRSSPRAAQRTSTAAPGPPKSSGILAKYAVHISQKNRCTAPVRDVARLDDRAGLGDVAHLEEAARRHPGCEGGGELQRGRGAALRQEEVADAALAVGQEVLLAHAVADRSRRRRSRAAASAIDPATLSGTHSSVEVSPGWSARHARRLEHRRDTFCAREPAPRRRAS